MRLAEKSAKDSAQSPPWVGGRRGEWEVGESGGEGWGWVGGRGAGGGAAAAGVKKKAMPSAPVPRQICGPGPAPPRLGQWLVRSGRWGPTRLVARTRAGDRRQGGRPPRARRPFLCGVGGAAEGRGGGRRRTRPRAVRPLSAAHGHTPSRPTSGGRGGREHTPPHPHHPLPPFTLEHEGLARRAGGEAGLEGAALAGKDERRHACDFGFRALQLALVPPVGLLVGGTGPPGIGGPGRQVGGILGERRRRRLRQGGAGASGRAGGRAARGAGKRPGRQGRATGPQGGAGLHRWGVCGLEGSGRGAGGGGDAARASRKCRDRGPPQKKKQRKNGPDPRRPLSRARVPPFFVITRPRDHPLISG